MKIQFTDSDDYCDKLIKESEKTGLSVASICRLSIRSYFDNLKKPVDKPKKLAQPVQKTPDKLIMDSIKQFCSNQVDVGAGYRTEINEIHQAYLRYCDENGLNSGSKRFFGRHATPDIAGEVYDSNGTRYRRARLKPAQLAQKTPTPLKEPTIAKVVHDSQCQDCFQIHDPGFKKCKACGSKNMKDTEN